MNFEYFALSRDLFYLSALSLGAGLGSLLMAFRKKNSYKKRLSWITTALFLGSLIFSALAGTTILSRAQVFTVLSLYPWGCFFLVLGTLVIRFFKAGSCTAIFAGGLFVVWICISFLSYPLFKEPERLSFQSSPSKEIIIRQDPLGPGDEQAWTIEDNGRPLVIEAAAVTAHPSYPIIGGERRGAIIRVLREDQELFTAAKNLYRLRGSGGLGFSLDRYTLDLSPEVLLSGISFSVLFNGRALYFDPPIQF
ncbi:MAG: hypothetical protein LBO65_08230 [Spirochaetaceae bacterium]|jgi:small neutral amino acid transporter SnatA (MarC family)|nr:hypothetical protein [Spirochaetaceae bacterium]